MSYPAIWCGVHHVAFSSRTRGWCGWGVPEGEGGHGRAIGCDVGLQVLHHKHADLSVQYIGGEKTSALHSVGLQTQRSPSSSMWEHLNSVTNQINGTFIWQVEVKYCFCLKGEALDMSNSRLRKKLMLFISVKKGHFFGGNGTGFVMKQVHSRTFILYKHLSKD